VIDPGLGFGKRKEQNAEILAHLQQLAGLDFPILVGPSRKSFLAQPSESGTLFATAAAVTAAILNGAHMVRVHDVKEMLAAVQVAEEIARAAAPKPDLKADEKLVVRAHTRTGPNFDAEPAKPARPPLAKRPVVKPEIEQPILPAAAAEAPAETPVVEAAPEPPKVFARPAFKPKDDRPRTPRPPYPDRDKRDGSRPPVSRPFTPRRPADRSDSAPPRGRDFRPGQGAAAGKDRFKPAGPKRPFVRDGDRPPRRDDDRPPRPGFKSPGFKPKGFKPSGPPRSFDREGRPERSSGPPRSGPPRSGPPRSGPPRSGPPRGDRPGSGPPKRPFRKRP
jgi:hypothetical protein